MGRRTAIVVVAVALLLTGYAGLDVLDRAPGILTLAPAPEPTPATPEATGTVPLPSGAPPGMPLAPAGDPAPLPTAAALQAATAPALAAMRGTVAAVVRDGTTGAHLLDDDPDLPVAPASVLKLLSAAAIDTTFPPGATLATRAVKDPAAARVHLVAGGDLLLSPGAGNPQETVGRAGLADLAAQTASALRSQGITSVTVAVDTTYAPGPQTAPTWPAAYRASGITGPVTAIGLATQRAAPGRPGPRDPAGEAARAFVSRLQEQQIAATLEPTPVGAPAGASTLGSVTSAPVADVLALALQESDNALTESLARQAAFRSGAGTDFASTAAFVRGSLAAQGVDLSGVDTVDASGLSGRNVLPARVVADVLALGVAGRVPGFTQTLRRLPVGALSGTLADRFAGAASAAGAGVVRAKTGTLTGVNAIAGTVVTADGRLLTFAVLQQGPGGTPVVRGALDRFGAALAQCGCR